MHNLRIEGRKIFLDGFEVKDVQGYELKENVGEPSEVTLRLSVQDIAVRPFQVARDTGVLYYGSTLATVGEGKPEVIAPLSVLQGMLDTSNEGVTDVLKQILATMKAADKETVIKIEGAELGGAAIKAINEVQRIAGSGPLNILGGPRMSKRRWRVSLPYFVNREFFILLLAAAAFGLNLVAVLLD